MSTENRNYIIEADCLDMASALSLVETNNMGREGRPSCLNRGIQSRSRHVHEGTAQAAYA